MATAPNVLLVRIVRVLSDVVSSAQQVLLQRREEFCGLTQEYEFAGALYRVGRQGVGASCKSLSWGPDGAGGLRSFIEPVDVCARLQGTWHISCRVA